MSTRAMDVVPHQPAASSSTVNEVLSFIEVAVKGFKKITVIKDKNLILHSMQKVKISFMEK